MTSIFHKVELFSLRSTVFSSEKGNEKHHQKGKKKTLFCERKDVRLRTVLFPFPFLNQHTVIAEHEHDPLFLYTHQGGKFLRKKIVLTLNLTAFFDGFFPP